MEIHLLGAHNSETRQTRCASLLIDKVLAFDAGGLTSALSLAGLKKVKALFLTHHHYDHVKDVPALGMDLFLNNLSVNVYAPAIVRQAIVTNFLNGDLYPKFFERPAEKPTLSFHEVDPGHAIELEDYKVLPVGLSHAVPDVGYQIISSAGKAVFYTGDTGPGLAECWKLVSPGLLIIEVTASNYWEQSMVQHGHLTPKLLGQELASFRQLKGYLPDVVATHLNPYLEAEIKTELASVARELGCSIRLAQEGMRIAI